MKTDKTSTSAFAPFFAKIEKLTRPQRIALYAVSMILVLAIAVYFFIWPKFQEIERYQNELAKVQDQLEKAKKNARDLNDWRTKMKKKEAEYRTVMLSLPEKEEIPSLLAGVSQAGKDAGLEFLLFQPKTESNKDFYAEIPVDIIISGNYHQVAVFFDKVANLPRIVNIRDVKMAPQSKDGIGNLTTTCQAVTYKFVETAAKQKQSKPN